jgi:hypothetical protein
MAAIMAAGLRGPQKRRYNLPLRQISSYLIGTYAKIGKSESWPTDLPTVGGFRTWHRLYQDAADRSPAGAANAPGSHLEW